MKNFIKRHIALLVSIILFALFITWTILVKVVDVQKIGPLYTEVGLASLNRFFASTFAFDETWYKITDLLMALPFIYAAFAVIIGIIQLIKRKNLFKVDIDVLLFGVGLVLLVIFFVLFEKVVINYRPVIVEGELEVSYPSTHCLMSIYTTLAVSLIVNNIFKDKKTLCLIINIVIYVLLGLSIGGRIAAGVHWISDIIGGILLSLAIYYLHLDFSNLVKGKIKTNEN